MREYRPLYSDSVAEIILGLPKRQQRRLVDACNHLAANPFVESSHSIRDSDGRDIEHATFNGFVVAYWVDHPVCRVMIIDIERVQ
jgi:hypothetical protein